MAELHIRPDSAPDERRDTPDRGSAERITEAEFDRDVAKAVEANLRQKDSETQEVDGRSPDRRRPGLVFEAPDVRGHDPEKPAQEHPDVTALYGPSGKFIADRGPDGGPSDPDRRTKPREVLDTATYSSDDLSHAGQTSLDFLHSVIDPDRPSLQEARTSTAQPTRPTFTAVRKDTLHDTTANAILLTIFAAEVVRRSWERGKEVAMNRRHDTE